MLFPRSILVSGGQSGLPNVRYCPTVDTTPSRAKGGLGQAENRVLSLSHPPLVCLTLSDNADEQAFFFYFLFFALGWMDVFVIFEFILHAVNVVAFLIEVAVVVDGVLGG